MTRILHVNKFSRIVGGVETHVAELRDAQIARGDDVGLFSLDDVDGAGFAADAHGLRGHARSAITLMWSRGAHDALVRRIRASAPDVVHFHNIYHHLSPSVTAAARRAGVATVMTLHDYKLVAPCYLLFREGAVCTACAGRRVPGPAVRHRCVKGSTSGSAVCATEQVVHAPLYRRNVDAFIAPSETARRQLSVSRAVRADRLHVVPHGVRVPEVRVDAAGASRTMLFFGRLSPEKGVGSLVEAWRSAALPEPWRLVIAGDGAERGALEQAAEGVPGVTFTGHLEGPQLTDRIRSAAVALVPSLFPETFGLSAAEAMAHGVPVLASQVGNLPDLLGNPEQLVRPHDTAAWAQALRWIAGSETRRAALGAAGRASIVDRFDPTLAASRTDGVYRAAREHAAAGGR